MISFQPSEGQEMARTSARRLAEAEIRPLARRLSADRRSEKAIALDERILGSLASLGIVQSVVLGESGDEFGARLMNALVLKELAFGDANCALAIAATLGFVRAVKDQGSAAQQERYLAGHGEEGHRFSTIAFAEAGPDTRGFAGLQTQITGDGGELRLDGVKILVPFAARCTEFLVIAKRGDGLVAAIVASGAPGVTIGPVRRTTGCCAGEFADVQFNGVRIKGDQLLGEGGGFDFMRLRNASRVATSAILCGTAQAAYDWAVQYVKDRKIGNQALGTKQSIALKIVDMFAEAESVRWMVWRSAGQIDRGLDADRMARLTHGRAIEVASMIADEAMQMMSGHGFMADSPMEAWYRNVRTLATLETSIGL